MITLTGTNTAKIKKWHPKNEKKIYKPQIFTCYFSVGGGNIYIYKYDYTSVIVFPKSSCLSKGKYPKVSLVNIEVVTLVVSRPQFIFQNLQQPLATNKTNCAFGCVLESFLSR